MIEKVNSFAVVFVFVLCFSVIPSYCQESENCGKPLVKSQGLIADFGEPSPGAWPWHVAIFCKEGDETKYRCGGTLVNANTVVTAGHCFFDPLTGVSLSADNLIVHLGKHNLNVVDDNTKEIKVRQLTLHKEFSLDTLNNDIGILKLDSNVDYNEYIQPICLSEEVPDREIVYKTGKVVGWGFIELGDTPADTLREASMPMIHIAECLESNRKLFGEFLSNSNFCAGYRNGTSVCSGDGGSGMYVETNESWKLRGIVSLGVKSHAKSTCNPQNYVLFTDVLRFITWIKENMN